MIRITTIFLCLLLAAAAAGRYRAEVSVRETRMELEKLETSKLEEERSIQMLRAEVAYLESPERLAKIAKAKTDLRPSDGEQTLNAQDFAAAFGDTEIYLDDDEAAPQSDLILHALAMAPVTTAQQ